MLSVFNNGLIIQWGLAYIPYSAGNVAVYDIIYPITFTQVWSFVFGIGNYPDAHAGGVYYINKGISSNQIVEWHPSRGGTLPLDWIIVGY